MCATQKPHASVVVKLFGHEFILQQPYGNNNSTLEGTMKSFKISMQLIWAFHIFYMHCSGYEISKLVRKFLKLS